MFPFQKNNKVLLTSWYRKPSNTLMFTQWNSNGPKIYKINLIRTMINRLKTICSNKWIFDRDLKQLKTVICGVVTHAILLINILQLF